jgi:hypothetical protein
MKNASPAISLMKLTDCPEFEFVSCEQARLKCGQLVETFRETRDVCLLRLLRLYMLSRDFDVELYPGRHFSTEDILDEMYNVDPNYQRFWYLKLLYMKEGKITLPSGEEKSESEAFEIFKRLSVHDDEGLMGYLFVCKELSAECQPSEVEREAEIQKRFIAAGGVHRRNMECECVGQSLCEDTNKQQLVGWLGHWLNVDLDEELSPDIRIVDTTIAVLYPAFSWLKEKIANALFELAALLRPFESVELGGVWYYAESIRRMAVHRYGIESIASRIYRANVTYKGTKRRQRKKFKEFF